MNKKTQNVKYIEYCYYVEIIFLISLFCFFQLIDRSDFVTLLISVILWYIYASEQNFMEFDIVNKVLNSLLKGKKGMIRMTKNRNLRKRSRAYYY